MASPLRHTPPPPVRHRPPLLVRPQPQHGIRAVEKWEAEDRLPCPPVTLHFHPPPPRGRMFPVDRTGRDEGWRTPLTLPRPFIEAEDPHRRQEDAEAHRIPHRMGKMKTRTTTRKRKKKKKSSAGTVAETSRTAVRLLRVEMGRSEMGSSPRSIRRPSTPPPPSPRSPPPKSLSQMDRRPNVRPRRRLLLDYRLRLLLRPLPRMRLR